MIQAKEKYATTLIRVVVSALISVALASSFFLTLLAPAPLLMLYYFKGARPFIAAQVLTILLSIVLSLSLGLTAFFLLILQMLILGIGVLIIYTLRAQSAAQLWKRFHGALLIVFLLVLGMGQWVRIQSSWQNSLANWLDKQVVQSQLVQEQVKVLKQELNSKEVSHLVELLSDAQKMKQVFWVELPQGSIFLFYLGAWINLLIAMRALRLRALSATLGLPADPLDQGEEQRVKKLLHHPQVVFFRNPDVVLYLIVASLGLIAWHYWQGGIPSEVLSWNYWALNLLAISYFFQGFPILNLCVQFLGINRGLGSFLIAITIIFSSWLVSLLGFVDHWIDIRSMMGKYLNNKNNPNHS